MKQIKYTRKYLGVTVTAQNYRSILEGPGSRDELRFHAKHLRAYLKGRDSFIHGWETREVLDPVEDKIVIEKIRPQQHPVQQEIILTFLDDQDQRTLRTFSSQKDLNSYLRKKNEDKFGKSK